MATLPVPERAVLRRARNLLHAEQELFLAIRAPQTPIPARWLREVVKLFLNKLPPAQPLAPGTLPQFNPSLPLQSLPSSPTPPGIIPRRTNTPFEERYSKISSVDEIFLHTPQLPRSTPTFNPIYERYERRLADLKYLLRPLTRETDGSGH